MFAGEYLFKLSEIIFAGVWLIEDIKLLVAQIPTPKTILTISAIQEKSRIHAIACVLAENNPVASIAINALVALLRILRIAYINAAL